MADRNLNIQAALDETWVELKKAKEEIHALKTGSSLTKANVMTALGITSISQNQIMSTTATNDGVWIKSVNGYHSESSFGGGAFLGVTRDDYGAMAAFKLLSDVPHIRYRKAGGAITDLSIEDIAKKDFSNSTSTKLMETSSTTDIAVIRAQHTMRIQAATYSSGTALWLKDDRNGNDSDYLGMTLFDKAPKLAYKKNGQNQVNIDLVKLAALAGKTLTAATLEMDDDTIINAFVLV